MWIYEKRLEFPVNIKRPNPALANLILTQYGGANGELGAAIRYLSQRFTMVTPQARAVLNDIGTEELGHLEMIGTIVHQLTRDVSPEDMKKDGLAPYYAEHGLGIYPQSAGGTPWSAMSIQSIGDPISDLYENMAADKKINRHNQNKNKPASHLKPKIYKFQNCLSHNPVLSIRIQQKIEPIYDYVDYVIKNDLIINRFYFSYVCIFVN